MNSIQVQCKMDNILMSSKHGKTSDSRRLILNLTDKISIKTSNEYVALPNLNICYTWKNIKNSNNKFKISAPMLNAKFELSDGSYTVSNFQDYFEYYKKTINTD